MTVKNISLTNHFYFAPEILTRRLNELTKKVNDIAKNDFKIIEDREDGYQDAIFIQMGVIDPFVPPQCTVRCCTIPVTFLIKKEDIPSHLLINSREDPRLNQQEFLCSVIDWLKEFTKHSGFTHSYFVIEKVKLFLKVLIDEKKAEEAKLFVISHELSHMYHKDHKTPNLLPSMDKCCKIAFFYLGGISTLVFLESTAYLPSGSFLFSTLVSASAFAYRFFSFSISSKQIEKRADLTAANIMHNHRGGIYVYEQFVQHGLSSRKTSHSMCAKIFSHIFYDPKGNMRLMSLFWPPMTERIRYLKAIDEFS